MLTTYFLGRRGTVWSQPICEVQPLASDRIAGTSTTGVEPTATHRRIAEESLGSTWAPRLNQPTPGFPRSNLQTPIGCGSEIGTQNGALANGNKPAVAWFSRLWGSVSPRPAAGQPPPPQRPAEQALGKRWVRGVETWRRAGAEAMVRWSDGRAMDGVRPGAKQKHTNHDTVDGQNPAPPDKLWEIIVCWYLQGNHHSRVS